MDTCFYHAPTPAPLWKLTTMPIYQHSIYRYADPDVAEYRALFEEKGDFIVVISGVETMNNEFGFWMVIPDSLFTGIWDLFSIVKKEYSADRQRVFMLMEHKARK